MHVAFHMVASCDVMFGMFGMCDCECALVVCCCVGGWYRCWWLWLLFVSVSFDLWLVVYLDVVWFLFLCVSMFRLS